MNPSKIVLEHPPKDNQIFTGIPLFDVVDFTYSRIRKQVRSYITKDGEYFLGYFRSDRTMLFNSCIKQSQAANVVPVKFVSISKTIQYGLTTWAHIPFSKVFDKAGNKINLKQELANQELENASELPDTQIENEKPRELGQIFLRSSASQLFEEEAEVSYVESRYNQLKRYSTQDNSEHRTNNNVWKEGVVLTTARCQ
ncbi:Hypothetical_protein [Hexamita inflata]|uniref:Hypothetical_protein n=1 Tax=Hexamita inflata TaxID=28002 RepID=A0AA86NWV4_9EUKA|nr:Hypothetical protein HINF_LOCUS15310 [Hexamita inflata]